MSFIEARYCKCIHRCPVRTAGNHESRNQPLVAATTQLTAEKCGNNKPKRDFYGIFGLSQRVLIASTIIVWLVELLKVAGHHKRDDWDVRKLTSCVTQNVHFARVGRYCVHTPIQKFCNRDLALLLKIVARIHR